MIQQSFQTTCNVKVNELRSLYSHFPPPPLFDLCFGLLGRQRCSVCNILAAGRVVPGAWRLPFSEGCNGDPGRLTVYFCPDCSPLYFPANPPTTPLRIFSATLCCILFLQRSLWHWPPKSHSPGHLGAFLGFEAFLEVAPNVSCLRRRGEERFLEDSGSQRTNCFQISLSHWQLVQMQSQEPLEYTNRR